MGAEVRSGGICISYILSRCATAENTVLIDRGQSPRLISTVFLL